MQSDFENQELIKNTIKRCPTYVAGLWRKRVFKVLEEKEKYPPFDDFVDFFKKISTQANDALYGQDFWNEMVNKKSTSGAGSSNAFSAVDVQSQSKSPAPKCVHCSGGHSLYQCESFTSLNPKDRLAKVRQKRLCFICLRAGHRSNECKCKHIHCTVPNCAKRNSHNTLIHIPVDYSYRQSVAAPSQTM